MRRLRLVRTEAAWLTAIVAYVAAVAVTRVQGGAPSFTTPRGVLHGRVVELLTSGLYVAGGPPVDDLAVPALAAALALAVLVVGARRTVAAGLLGHVGATLVVYAAIGASGSAASTSGAPLSTRPTTASPASTPRRSASSPAARARCRCASSRSSRRRRASSLAAA